MKSPIQVYEKLLYKYTISSDYTEVGDFAQGEMHVRKARKKVPCRDLDEYLNLAVYARESPTAASGVMILKVKDSMINSSTSSVVCE